jgi:hypothetical protein
MLREVLKDRDVIMSEVALHLQEVVCALRDYENNEDNVAFRMADFAEFALAVASYAKVYDQVKITFKKLSLEQSYFTLEDDPIFDLLLLWVPGNEGREVTTADLCRELAVLALKRNIDFPYEDKVQAFGQRLNNIKENLSAVFKITRHRGKARKSYYSFLLKLDGEKTRDRGETGEPTSS